MSHDDYHYIHTLSGVFDKFDAVCRWFEGLGFTYARTRYGIYKRRFDEFERIGQSGDCPVDLLLFKRSFDNAYIEVNEIIRVHDSLRHIDSKEFNDQITKSLAGREFRSDADQSRNFVFELSVACRFLRAGYTVRLTDLCDVVVNLGSSDGHLYVECKRIKSKNQIAKNVKKASRQVGKRLSNDCASKAHGLLAVNITDLLPHTRNLYPDSPQIATAIHKTISNQFVGRHIQDFATGISDDCLGVMCESSIMAYLSERSSHQGLHYSRHTEFLPYCENAILERLAPQLCNQDIIS
jgi:hypothetical protein